MLGEIYENIFLMISIFVQSIRKRIRINFKFDNFAGIFY
jgi:hypothetical protein